LIPAILSCVFVIYLYQSLNKNHQGPMSSSHASATASDAVRSMIDRLEAMQQRLDSLSSQNKKGGDQ
jgi:hypothetical protein